MNAAVVTGIGVVAPNGMNTEEYWNATLAARSGIGRITRFAPDGYRATLAGEIRGFDPAAHLPGRLVPQTDHSTRLSLVAADEAVRDAGLDTGELPEYGVGVVTANSAGGFEFGHQELDNLWRKGPEYVSAYQSFAWFYAVNTGQISIRHGLRGPGGVLVSDEAGGLDALAQARRLLRRGLSAVVTGAVDGSLCPWGWIAQTATGQLSAAEDPRLAYRPFDEEAAGFVPGEGGAMLVLEDEAAARKRGAPGVRGRILGHAATFGPKPGTVPPDDATALRRAIELALADAGADARDIDAVFADAAGVPDLDRAEAAALTAVFGARELPVCVPKTLTGRLCAGAGPLDVATALLALRDGVLPPAVHTRPSPRYGLSVVVGRPRELRMRAVLVVARGLGGFNSAMVVGGSH
ncbi:act minimal PKS chain-length factor (CLF/KS beta) [Streptomyces aurantiacus]|uniref:ketosynthase chain-length factor n=1 Tax=Streptomyces aurantiacus TaxID=47760 RepID=UPI002791AC6D|nr:ketosynthase chain-length factor [Streptomyces aurantiacus]MDQ0779126.1 act minimal PKS chain-length factor (CLF/KS beta) [Streptomyces aurantiacus]